MRNTPKLLNLLIALFVLIQPWTSVVHASAEVSKWLDLTLLNIIFISQYFYNPVIMLLTIWGICLFALNSKKNLVFVPSSRHPLIKILFSRNGYISRIEYVVGLVLTLTMTMVVAAIAISVLMLFLNPAIEATTLMGYIFLMQTALLLPFIYYFLPNLVAKRIRDTKLSPNWILLYPILIAFGSFEKISIVIYVSLLILAFYPSKGFSGEVKQQINTTVACQF